MKSHRDRMFGLYLSYHRNCRWGQASQPEVANSTHVPAGTYVRCIQPPESTRPRRGRHLASAPDSCTCAGACAVRPRIRRCTVPM